MNRCEAVAILTNLVGPAGMQGYPYNPIYHEAEHIQCVSRKVTPHPTEDREDLGLMPTHLSSSMQAMYHQQLFTDLTIMIEGQTLHAHRAVLASASPVFAQMFSSNWQEGGHGCLCQAQLMFFLP